MAERTLTDADLEAIKESVGRCHVGLSQNDVYEMKQALTWWRKTKEKAGEALIKALVYLAVGVGAVVAMITQPWRQ